MLRVYTRPAGLHQLRAQPVQCRDVELGVAVQPAGLPRALRRQHPVGADDLASAVLAHQQMVTVLVERVDVQAGVPGVQHGTHLAREDPMPKPLRGADLVVGPGDEQ